MSKDELVEACDKALKGGRLDAAGEILWDECESLRAQLTQAREALEPFVRQVDEFGAGWNGEDWPVALAYLKKQAEAARAALSPKKETT